MEWSILWVFVTVGWPRPVARTFDFGSIGFSPLEIADVSWCQSEKCAVWVACTKSLAKCCLCYVIGCGKESVSKDIIVIFNATWKKTDNRGEMHA